MAAFLTKIAYTRLSIRLLLCFDVEHRRTYVERLVYQINSIVEPAKSSLLSIAMVFWASNTGTKLKIVPLIDTFSYKCFGISSIVKTKYLSIWNSFTILLIQFTALAFLICYYKVVHVSLLVLVQLVEYQISFRNQIGIIVLRFRYFIWFVSFFYYTTSWTICNTLHGALFRDSTVLQGLSQNKHFVC